MEVNMPFKRRVLTSASEDRLEQLIEKRLSSGTDKENIDRRIWDLFGENWCVMFTDLAGFSRNVSKFGIIHFLQTIYESQRILVPIIENHDGILLKTEGDSFMILFRNVRKGLQCAIAMQAALRKYNEKKQEEEEVLLCVGIGYGRVLRIGDEDVYGVEVNAASKLGEDYAKAYDVIVTQAVKNEAGNMESFFFEETPGIIFGSEKIYKVIY
jgi:class 3 adenylate cyclase